MLPYRTSVTPMSALAPIDMRKPNNRVKVNRVQLNSLIQFFFSFCLIFFLVEGGVSGGGGPGGGGVDSSTSTCHQ